MLITLTEYADKIGRERSAVYKKLRNGDFETAVRVGNGWLIDSDEPYTTRKPGRKTARETTAYIIAASRSDWTDGSGYTARDVPIGTRTVTTDRPLHQLLKTIDWSWIERRESPETTDREWSATLYAADDTALEHPIARRSVWESDLA